MSDQELADAVVALGVLTMHNDDRYSFSPISPDPRAEFFTARQLVRDPRVAMALLEKIPGDELRLYAFGQAISDMKVGNTISRAITEACVEALSNG